MTIPAQPEFSCGMMATFELRDYRAELERALKSAPEDSADRQVIATRLQQVTDEQDSRARFRKDTREAYTRGLPRLGRACVAPL